MPRHRLPVAQPAKATLTEVHGGAAATDGEAGAGLAEVHPEVGQQERIELRGEGRLMGWRYRRINDHPASRLHELLPWNWKKPVVDEAEGA